MGRCQPHVGTACRDRDSATSTSPTQAAATVPPVPPPGVPRSTRVVPAERNPTWNEVTWHGDSQQWHGDTRATLLTAVTCPADTGVAAGCPSPAPLGQPGPAPPALGPASTPGVSGTHGWAPQGAVPKVAVLTVPVPPGNWVPPRCHWAGWRRSPGCRSPSATSRCWTLGDVPRGPLSLSAAPTSPPARWQQGTPRHTSRDGWRPACHPHASPRRWGQPSGCHQGHHTTTLSL